MTLVVSVDVIDGFGVVVYSVVVGVETVVVVVEDEVTVPVKGLVVFDASSDPLADILQT